MSSPDDIAKQVDADLEAAPARPARCGRGGCGRPSVAGHDFCPPCLAWLRGETDADPLDDDLPDEDAQPCVVDSVVEWVEQWVGLHGGGR